MKATVIFIYLLVISVAVPAYDHGHIDAPEAKAVLQYVLDISFYIVLPHIVGPHHIRLLQVPDCRNNALVECLYGEYQLQGSGCSQCVPDGRLVCRYVGPVFVEGLQYRVRLYLVPSRCGGSMAVDQADLLLDYA